MVTTSDGDICRMPPHLGLSDLSSQKHVLQGKHFVRNVAEMILCCSGCILLGGAPFNLVPCLWCPYWLHDLLTTASAGCSSTRNLRSGHEAGSRLLHATAHSPSHFHRFSFFPEDSRFRGGESCPHHWRRGWKALEMPVGSQVALRVQPLVLGGR